MSLVLIVLSVVRVYDSANLFIHHMTLAVTVCLFCKAEDGIRDLVRSRGLGDVYKRQRKLRSPPAATILATIALRSAASRASTSKPGTSGTCLLYTSDAADERSSVDLGGRRIIKKTTKTI